MIISITSFSPRAVLANAAAHLTEEAMESYVLKHNNDPQEQAAEEHLMTCFRCRHRLTEMEADISLLQAALSVERDPATSL